MLLNGEVKQGVEVKYSEILPASHWEMVHEHCLVDFVPVVTKDVDCELLDNVLIDHIVLLHFLLVELVVDNGHFLFDDVSRHALKYGGCGDEEADTCLQISVSD